MLAQLVSEGTAVSEAMGVLEVRWWHDRRAATLGWSMAPDPSCLSCSVAFVVSNVQGHDTTRELRLVALNCERMVDNGSHTLAVYSPMQQSCRSTRHAPLLHYCHCLPRFYIQHKKRWCIEGGVHLIPVQRHPWLTKGANLSPATPLCSKAVAPPSTPSLPSLHCFIAAMLHYRRSMLHCFTAVTPCSIAVTATSLLRIAQKEMVN